MTVIDDRPLAELYALQGDSDFTEKICRTIGDAGYHVRVHIIRQDELVYIQRNPGINAVPSVRVGDELLSGMREINDFFDSQPDPVAVEA
ncbi:MAG: hypothetical protein Q7S53_00705 [bacterium]|nr:hypothetical protein [bacterium]